MDNMTLEEALAAADVSTTPVNDILMVDAEARTIIVPASEMLFGVRQDMDAERKHFKCPKIVGDNVDLSNCHIYISYVPSKQDGTYDINEDVGAYLCEDLDVDGDYVTFSWKLSGNVFVKAGYIAFAVYAKQADADGNLQTKWHTTFAIGKVLDTLPDGEQIVEKYADVIEQLLNRMDAFESIATPEAMQNYVEAYLAENPPSGMTAEEKEQLDKNTEDISSLSEDIADQYAKKSAIPTKVSQLTNDSGYLTKHQDISGKAEAVSLIDRTSQAQANLTPAEILQAMQAGKILMAIGGVCTLMNYSGTSQVVVHRQYSDSNIVAKVTINSDKSYAIELVTLAKNADLTAHTGNSTVHITADERKNWNAKSDFSGNYDDLNGAPSSMKNPFALKINGTSYDGSKEVNLVIEGGGASGESELLGETPLTLSKDISTINLVGSGDVSYAIQSPTVADLENTTNITYSNCKLVQQDGYVELQSTGGSGWYSNYADIVLSGLTIGESYVIYVDGLGRTDSTENHRYCGYYIACSGESYSSSNQIGSTGGNYAGYTTNIETLKIEFTATTESVCVRMYPSSNAYFSSGVSVSEINSIYINRAGSNVHTSILNVSGTFTDSKMLYSIPSGTTISSTPSCSVYGIITGSGDSSKPMYGKTIVCFGDSLFGMYRGDTSAPAYIQEITGATVHNVGFGGCRMSVHPSSGYAEFCMWALAKAIAENDWTSQDSAASSGSDYFPDQLALLESIDFSSVDAVVIHYGTNDFGGSVAIGSDSSSSDYTTLCGALRYSIEKLLGSYPELRIYISLPVFRFWTGSDGTVTYSDTYKNSQSNTLVEVVNAIADVAKEYNLPVIDCYRGLGINKANASTFLLDGTHHNEVGRKRFGNFIGSQIVANR